jgi:hypothetical protein
VHFFFSLIALSKRVVSGRAISVRPHLSEITLFNEEF